MKKTIDYLGKGFIWFFGIVEDISDPLESGRVRVRCHGWHSTNTSVLPTADLPWAQMMQPVTSAASGNIGSTPTGIIVGSWVMGFFLDGEGASMPLVMGTLGGVPDVPDINELARSGTDHAVIAAKAAGIKSNVDTALEGSWSEFAVPSDSNYPWNHVKETPGGHISERDDTAGYKRSLEYHPAGTYEEVGNDGEKVTHVVNDNYTVVLGTDYIYVSGDCNLTVDGTVRLKAAAVKLETTDLDVRAENYRLEVTGEMHEYISGDKYTYTGGDTYSKSSNGTNYSDPTVVVRTGVSAVVDVDQAG